jgi:hypothetical protein
MFRAAIIGGATSIVVMHNHPSGDPTPSYGDRTTTDMLRKAGQTVKIEVQDHVIIGADTYVSLRALGYFSTPDSPEVPLAEIGRGPIQDKFKALKSAIDAKDWRSVRAEARRLQSCVSSALAWARQVCRTGEKS